MALLDINKISKINKSRVYVHKVVEGTYSVFTDTEGKKYFQIDTYGSVDRELQNKISQTIQFDKETARYLINLISNELGLTEI